MEAELGAKISHQIGRAQPLRAVTSQRFVVITVVGGQYAVVVAQEDRIVGGFLQESLVHATQEGFRVVTDGVPQASVQARIECARWPIPAVPQVGGDLLQARYAWGNPRVDFDLKSGARLHRASEWLQGRD